MAAGGLTTMPSNFGAKETVDRLEAEITAKGMTVALITPRLLRQWDCRCLPPSC